MHWHKILTPLFAVAISLTSASWASAQSASDEVLLQMREAARKGDREQLRALLPRAAGHPLEPWAAYWTMRAHLGAASAADVQAFLQRWKGTYQEDRLRNDWLLLLGQRRQWNDFSAMLPQFRMQDDKEVRCYALAVDTIRGQLPPLAREELLRLWYGQRDTDDGCTHAASEMHAAGHIDDTDVWRRARLQAESNKPVGVRNAVDIVLPQARAHVNEALASPTKYLNGKSKLRQDIRRQIAVLALVRMAVRDPEEAAKRMQQRWHKNLKAEERDWVWGVIGKVAARRLDDGALDYFAKVQKLERMPEESLEWMARAALRAGQWGKALKVIDVMPQALQADNTWVYWKAMALKNTPGASAAARSQSETLLRSIAGPQGFYEQLAQENLGQSISVPAPPPALTAQERRRAETNPGLQRALKAIAMGLRQEGVREWNYTIGLHVPGGMNDRELLAAAQLACDAHLWDRCINTSERTRSFMHWGQRFPMPFQQQVVAQAQRIGLDPAYVYGLIRQESRFIMDARSHVGASGLMQVMPATAKWTAKKIGMEDFQPQMINDRDVNITIGTSYLKLALDDFDGSMVLAAAGYNAGPGRPRNWRNGPVLDAAIWAENVPFTETRDYVKKVLSNTTSYAAILTQQPQSLRARLGTVGPKATPTEYNADLP